MYTKNKKSITKEFIVFNGNSKEAIENLVVTHNEEVFKRHTIIRLDNSKAQFHQHIVL